MRPDQRTALCWTLLTLLSAALPALTIARGQGRDDMEHEAIQYLKTEATDPIAQLQKEIDAGRVKLEFDKKNGYLRSVLKNLRISQTSQTLVFAKTSLQRERITPHQPRALYFNDQTYIGFVQDSPILEISSTDPQLGGTFYLLPQTPSAKPKFIRQTYECLQCHSGSLTNGVAGHIMRSVYPRADGQPEFRAGTYLTSDQSPFNERWGGWYVTGKHGFMRHLGNVMATGEGEAPLMDKEAGANLARLDKILDVSPYLAPYSDVVALMTLGHQVNLHNLITRANWHTRMALNYEQQLNKELGRPEGSHLESTMSRIKSVCDPLVRGLLFSKAEPFPCAITGTSGYAEAFSKQGVFDKKGRNLREFDLKTRLFKYPCSYLVYSPEFAALPPIAKEFVYRRLWEALSGTDKSADFAHLSEADRTAIREILSDTKPEFLQYKPR